ncbi:putative Methanol utilization control sensor protein [Methylacidimicrobium sp. AP8]|uniref:PAS domain-containing sensor histidine kinase n=1 Tax=Methylacidimicrobium sp. AP8 TaxID=2730359 RepID=UPI0018C0C455|nr:PAS domain S-box protein [Methylacidimicrobium sp. AP8]CAB4243780.1 putative Methanol utilization control sensor protein [Methylacidimicrobium sp. AP8]
MDENTRQFGEENSGRRPCRLSIANCLGPNHLQGYCSIAGWMQQMLDQMLEGMLVLDTAFSIEIVNRAAADIFGYLPGELFGRPLATLLHTPDQIVPSFGLPHRPDGHASFARGRHEALGRRKNGEVFPLELSLSQSAVEGGSAITVLVRDLSERRALERALFEAETNERLRIGQDIHDSLCQMLIGIHYQAELLQSRLRDRSLPESALALRIGELVREAGDCARTLSQGLMPLAISPAELPQALADFARKSEERSGIRCRFALLGQPSLQDSATAVHLYQIAQEAVHNAIRHGRPRRIEIVLGERADSTYLLVADDGEGMGPKSASRPGLGMRSMRYRAGLIGGVIRFESKPKGGVTVLCTVPAGRRRMKKGSRK